MYSDDPPLAVAFVVAHARPSHRDGETSPDVHCKFAESLASIRLDMVRMTPHGSGCGSRQASCSSFGCSATARGVIR
jgi:hypothetical protein